MLESTLTIEAVKEIEKELTSIKTSRAVTIADLFKLTTMLDALIWTDMQLWHKVISRYETQCMAAAVFSLETSVRLFKETAESVKKLREQYKDEPEQLEAALNSEYIKFMGKLKGDIKIAG